MLEIFAIIWLTNKNKATALSRGRKPGGFMGLTIALWFGLEFIGILLGFAGGLELGAYVLGLVLAIVGGVISYLAAKNCRPGDYVLPAAVMVDSALRNTQPLAAPARIDIVREASMVGAIVSWSFTLNGQFIGNLGNGKAMTVYTNQNPNVLIAKDAYGTEIAPFVFSVQGGGFAELHFKINRFIPERSRGLLPQGAPPAAPPVAQPAQSGPHVLFCVNCGAKLAADMMFCIQCGTPRTDEPQSGSTQAVLPPHSGGGYAAAAPQYESVYAAAAPQYDGMYPAATAQYDGAYAAAVPQYGSAYAAAVPQYVGTAAIQPAAESSVNRPVRIIWTAAIVLSAWLLLLLLQAAIGTGKVFNVSAVYVLTDMLMGAGAYLLMQRGVNLKITGACSLILAALTVTFNITAISITSQRFGGMQDYFQHYIFWPAFGYALINVVIVAGLSLLFSHIWRNREQHKRVVSAGWIAAGGAALYGVIRMLVVYLPYISTGAMRSANMIVSIIGYIIDAVVIGLFVMTLTGISRLRKDRLRLSAWPIVWCSLCSLGMLTSLILSITERSLTPALLVLMIAALTGFILLLFGKREGFFVALIAVSVYLISTFETSLQTILLSPSGQVAILLGAIIGAANPVITWFSIRTAWTGSGIPQTSSALAWQTPAYKPQKVVKTFSKVVTIIVLVIGAGLFFLPFPFIIQWGYSQGMEFSFLTGAVLAAFSTWATVSLFGKHSVYRKWLDVLMQVLFWLTCALVAGTLILAAVNA